MSPTGGDPEKQNITVNDKLDIEHALVEDDPRIWTSGRKVTFMTFKVVGIMVSLIAGPSGCCSFHCVCSNDDSWSGS